MSRITEELKVETKQNILKEATALFQEKGFQKTTTKAIAKACKIAEGTVFNYFPTKDDLLIAVFEHMAQYEDEHMIEHMPQPLDQIIEIALDPFRKMSRIPRSFLLDILISSMKLAKKRPQLFHRLAKLDFDYMEKIKEKLDHFGDFEQSTITSSDLAEMIYGVAVMRFIIQVYEADADFKTFKEDMTPRLRELIRPYLKEVLRHD